MSGSSDSSQTLNYAVPRRVPVEPTRKWGVVASAIGIAALAVVLSSRYSREYYRILGPVSLILGLSALLTGLMGVASGRSRRSREGLLLSLGGLVLGATASLGSLAPLPSLGCTAANRCASNLRTIGQAIMLYANEHAGHLPADFAEVLSTQDVTAAIFICDYTTDTPTTRPQERVTSADLQGGHCSYIYLAKGRLPATMPATFIMACEPLGHHPDGTSFLYGDGHVDFVPTAKAMKVLAELNAGHNPPRPEALK
jgi:prepilin-type processing-associated H-X9-DG protein